MLEVTVSKMKNASEGLCSELGKAMEETSQLRDRSVETLKTKMHGEK